MLGPQNVEDNPGAIPLNDRGFCLPVSVTPILPPRLPTTIPLEYGIPGMDNRGQQHQRRNSHPNNRHNQGGYQQMNGGYPMEMPQMPPPPMFQGLLGPNPTGFPQYNPNPLNSLGGRPPLPPQAMYGMGGMAGPLGYPQANDINMRMIPNVPNLGAVSMDPYESLLMATERLSVTTQDSQSFMGNSNNGSDAISPSNHESISNRSSRSLSGISSGNAGGTPTSAQNQQHQQQLQQQQLMNSMSTYAPYPAMNPQAMNMNFMNMIPQAAMFGPTPTGPMDNKGGYYFN
jgi:hypothetical protein